MFDESADRSDVPRDPILPPPTALAARLREVVDALRDQDPAGLDGPVALADAELILAELNVLQAVALQRVGDVHVRRLHLIVGAPSTSSWIDQRHSVLDRGAVALAKKLGRVPVVAGLVQEGELSLPAAERIAITLDTLRRHVDRDDRLIDGQPAEEVLETVIVDGVLALIARARGGFDDDDPLLAQLADQLMTIAAAPLPGIARLERALAVLARHVEPAQLAPALQELTDATLPVQHEGRAERAWRQRSFHLTPKADGSGWTPRGDLDLELGELLNTVVTASLATDPDNPVDTEAWAVRREAAERDGLPLGAFPAGDEQQDVELTSTLGAPPRTRGQRQHDALKLGLRRLLNSGILGLRDKVAPHVNVTVSVAAMHDEPGVLPAVTDAGVTWPRSWVRRTLADSYLTRVVLSLGRRVMEVSHGERTLKAHERRALTIQHGGRCFVAGCRNGPRHPLRPHHGTPWSRTGSTSLADAVLICDENHHDLHVGGAVLRLKDGRWLGPDGWRDGPDEPRQDLRAS